MKIINLNKLTLKEKNNYVNRVNKYLTAKYNYDNSYEKARSVKSKLTKEIILLLWVNKKLKKI
jgi:hypothetical protein